MVCVRNQTFRNGFLALRRPRGGEGRGRRRLPSPARPIPQRRLRINTRACNPSNCRARGFYVKEPGAGARAAAAPPGAFWGAHLLPRGAHIASQRGGFAIGARAAAGADLGTRGPAGTAEASAGPAARGGILGAQGGRVRPGGGHRGLDAGPPASGRAGFRPRRSGREDAGTWAFGQRRREVSSRFGRLPGPEAGLGSRLLGGRSARGPGTGAGTRRVARAALRLRFPPAALGPRAACRPRARPSPAEPAPARRAARSFWRPEDDHLSFN